ncbi:MAG: glycosyltransferase family 39 protein [Nanoarchaeota archaeon]
MANKSGDNRLFFIILALGILVRLIVLFIPHVAFWDAAVYIGMGKYLFSNHQVGLWEDIRPIAWPAFLGLIWRLGLDPLVAGRIIDALISISLIPLTFTLAKRVTTQKAATVAAVFVAFSPMGVFFSSKVLTENVMTALMLLSFILILSRKHAWWHDAFAGVCAALAFLVRWRIALMFIPLLAAVIVSSRKGWWRRMPIGGATAFVTVTPYFLFNWFSYGSLFAPMTSLFSLIGSSGAYHPVSLTFYLRWFFWENPLYPLFIVGAVYAWRQKNWVLVALAAVPILYFSFFSSLDHKELRYLFAAIPFVAILVAHAMSRWRISLTTLVGVLSAVMFCLAASYFIVQTGHKTFMPDPDVIQQVYGNDDVAGIVASSGPQLAAYRDVDLRIVYWVEDYSYDLMLRDDPDWIFWDTCQFMCVVPECYDDLDDFMMRLLAENSIVFEKRGDLCSQFLLKRGKA